jgi:RNA polymerase primary sigma factor
MSVAFEYAGQPVSERKYSGEAGAVPSWGYSSDVPLLERAEELALVRRARAGDHAAMSRLIAANIRLVYSVARRYRCRTHSLEDLVQEGILGLMLAVERFDETRGCRLSTYALHWIRQSIARAAEQNDRLIHMPAQAKSELRQLRKLVDQQRAVGREPSEAELAAASGLSEERVQQLLGSVQEPVSLEASVGTEQDCLLLELAEDPDAVNPEHDAVKDAYREQVRELVSCLRPRERWVVEERFGLAGGSPRTLDELSQRLRISREGVRQIEVRAIRKLRHALRCSQWD